MAFLFIPQAQIPGLIVIDPKVFADGRGWFMETYKQTDFETVGINAKFVQASHSQFAKAGALRGLHLQLAPFTQGKLVRCMRGKIYDVAVDIRKGSPAYGKHFAVELSEENKRLFWIPEGFAHGVCSLVDNSELEYLMTNEWSPQHERSLLWNDPALGISWPVRNPILSPKDALGVPLEKLDHNFTWSSALIL